MASALRLPQPSARTAAVLSNQANATLRKQAEDALYECGVITDIIGKLATLMIRSSDEVCGTSFDWLTEQLHERHESIREMISTGSFGRGG